MDQLPFYRLRQLIVNKYGEEKFTTGCALVAWWVSFETKQVVSIDEVKLLCAITSAPINGLLALTGSMARALKTLFNLSSYKELYTLPETTPEFFN